MSVALSALQIKIGFHPIIIAESSGFNNDLLYDLEQLEELPKGWQGILKRSSSTSGRIYYTLTPSSGFQNLQLFENTEYFLITSSLKPDTSGFELNSLPGKDIYRFSIKNYLGSAYLSFENGEYLYFDVISKKLRYADEYHSMVSSIARECNQLLLDWSTPTSLPFLPDPSEHRKIILEQFLFLRHVLSSERLDLYLEIIRRNPHTALAEEVVWKPAGTSCPSPEYFQDPIRFGRGWTNVHTKSNPPWPQEIMTSRKYETLDTPTNRFIRFALETFRDICDLVIQEFAEEQGTAWSEAHDMRNALDAFLADPFFSDVCRLNCLPVNNQTLMKREGYRQILHAWLMVDTAAQLDWPGREDAYDGTKRDVPTLYEYWIYFVFRNLLNEVENLEEIPIISSEKDPNTVKPFLVKDEKGLRINLKRGKTSVSVFRWTAIDNISLRVNFYFDREFGRNKKILQQGTYSRAFRPDYTLVIFPDFNLVSELVMHTLEVEEALAEESGCIAYLHFDAKYRVEEIKDFFGCQEASNEDSEEVDREKNEAKKTNTYRRGDLYKMHTYNEAIRRTVGSYVIYPGTDDHLNREERLFRRYHEILPGVGAFLLRPLPNGQDKTFDAAGRNTLLEFIRDVLHIQQNRFSQLYRMNYWTHNTVKQESSLAYNPRVENIQYSPEVITGEIKPPSDTMLLIGYIRPEAVIVCQEKKIFYYHAVEENGKTTNFDPRIFDADYFLPYTTNGKLLGWVAKIRSTKLISRKDLLEYIDVSDNTSVIKSNSQYYYLVLLDKPYELDTEVESISKYITKRARNPFIKSWAELFYGNR